MSVVTTDSANLKALMSVEKFQALPNEKDFELVDGQLVERQTGFESSFIAVQLASLLFVYNQTHKRGWVQGADCGFRLPLPGEPTVRRPDVSFTSFERLSADKGIPKGYPKLAPDLAVEVLSPNDLIYAVDDKIKDYLDAGVKLIWIINPSSRSVQVFRQNGTTARLVETDHLDGEDLLPGFKCLIASLFEVPQPAKPV